MFKSYSGLLRTSKSSPSWTFESLAPILIVAADVLVFVYDLRAWSANIWDKNQEFPDDNKDFGNPGRRGPEHILNFSFNSENGKLQIKFPDNEKISFLVSSVF